MTPELETGDMLVITVAVPTQSAAELEITAQGNVVRVAGPNGFRHEVTLAEGADTGRLQAGFFMGFLELRAPRAWPEAPGPRQSRRVPVRELC